MASTELIKTVKAYDNYIEKHGITEEAVNAYVQAARVAIKGEKDVEYGLKLTKTVKPYINKLIAEYSDGGTFWQLDKYAQDNKTTYNILTQGYEVYLLEAPYLLDSFMLYIEHTRLCKERFYLPRRRTLSQVTNGLQRLEDDKLDELFIHMPARVGKTQELTLGFAWHCARDTEKSNLYVTYKEGLGGAFLDGIKEIYTDPIYAFADVFPDVRIVDTDAKNNKLDLGRIKKYKTLSGKGMESGLNGEYDAYGWLGMDDMYEGIQDVLSEDIRKRKQKIFNNNVIKRAKENCKKIWNGTIWSLDDIFMNRQRFLEENPEAKDIRYEIIKIPALDPETDESNFDYDYGVGFSTKHYHMERAKFEEDDDMASWWAQDQQEPIERDGQVFDPSHMRYFKTLPDGEPLKIVAHCDSALGGGDYTSFPIAYVYINGDEEDVYIPDLVFDNSEKHITQPQVVDKIKKHGIKNVHFESNQGGEAYKDDIARMLKEDGYNGGRPINITSSWALVTKRKAQRIFDHAQSIRQYYFLEPQLRDIQYKKFMQNLFSFSMQMRKRAHDDAADSLAGLDDVLIKGSGIATVQAVTNPFRRKQIHGGM